jgi:ribosome-binding protein aMBF1 (putative translation factor)
MTTLASLKEKWLTDSKIRQHYEDLGEEFEIALALIKARDEAGYSQNDVAEKMHTKQSVISRMESGRMLPSLSSILRYAKAIGYHAKISFEKAS